MKAGTETETETETGRGWVGGCLDEKVQNRDAQELEREVDLRRL